MDSRCPRKLNSLPTEPCQEGRKGVDAARKGQEGGCPWFVADQEACYCVWKLLAQEGRPLSEARVAQLAMIEEKEVKAIEKRFKEVAKTIL
jgi:hypothetical protein